ncbi:MAG TPA: TetR/AcrR family transcriptional regulator [Caulobacteraceae bacterium]|jgi:AcrR family transcriptional regulator
MSATSEAVAIGNLRQRALRAAQALLEANGEAATSLRAIAAELGTGVGSLYYHFANKDALLAELAINGFAELSRWMEMAANAPPGGRTRFNAAGHAYLGFTRHRPALYALMYNERILAGHDGVRRAEADAFEIYRRSLEGHGIGETEIADVALAFWALGRGMAAISCTRGQPGVAKDIAWRAMRGLQALAGAPIPALGLSANDAA